MDIIGKTTIHPLIFYSGKFAGYFIWITLLLSYFEIWIFKIQFERNNVVLLYLILFVSSIFIIISLFNLGKSTRLGLPADETLLKRKGLYRISRNPMYLGFNLLTISAIIRCPNIWVIILGLYSIIVYHFIILGEEAFLEKRFGSQYLYYKKKVRRYI